MSHIDVTKPHYGSNILNDDERVYFEVKTSVLNGIKSFVSKRNSDQRPLFVNQAENAQLGFEIVVQFAITEGL